MVGALGEWTLAHADLSLQSVLGQTSSSGEIRGPITRIRILEALLSSPDNNLNLEDLRRDVPEIHELSNALLAMPLFIEHRTKVSPGHNRGFRIISAAIPQNVQTARTKALYKTLADLEQQGVDRYDVDSLVALVIKSHPDQDASEIRHNLLTGASHQAVGRTRFPGLKFDDTIEAGNFEVGKSSSISIKRERIAAGEDLITRLENIRTGERTVRYIQTARDILADPSLCQAIMSKALEHSSKLQFRQRGTTITQEADAIVRKRGDEAEPMTSREVHKALEDAGIKASLHSVRIALSDLTKKGVLKIHRKPYKTGDKRTLNAFSVIDK